MIGLIVFLAVATLLLLIRVLIACDKCDIYVIFLVVVSYILGGIVVTYLNGRKPSAMDVYRGKTTLLITYRDSIPVDSIAVWRP